MIPGNLERWVTRAVELAAAGMLCLMSVLVILQVFFRYVLNSPLIWSEELARLSMIWLAFLGAAVALRRGAHIKLEGMDACIPSGLRQGVSRVIDLLLLGLCVLLSVESFKLAQRTHHQLLAALQIPVSYMYGAVLVGMLLMVLYQAGTVIRSWGPGRPADDPDKAGQP